MAVWPTFNLVATLKDGFIKTGIFPFSKEVIRDTLRSVSKPAVGAASSSYSPQKRQLRVVLADMNLSDTNINSLIEDADRKARGVSAAYNIADTFRSVLLRHNPHKK